MKYRKHIRLTEVTLLVLLFLFVSTRQAHAYLDPGSGSYIIQLLIAGLVGGLFGIKTFWFQIKTFFTNILSRKKQKKTDSAPKKNNGK